VDLVADWPSGQPLTHKIYYCVAVLYVAAGVLGVLIGSFLNVVIHRVPREESLLRPASHCPACGTPIRPWHNVPVVSWFVLRGRCAACGARISAVYPLVELTTAVLFIAVTWRLSSVGLLSALPAYLYFAAIAVALTVIDLRVRRLPNAIVLPSYPVLAVLLTGSAAWQGDWWSLARALIGAAVLFAFYFLLAFIYPAGMGMGDVKLAGLLGGVLAYLSWVTLVVGAFLGFLFGALAGIALIVAKRAGRKTAIPFGPWMIAGALVAFLAADALAQFYVDALLGR
jgi:leader peptidase (prepilin peptidase)/N-methyltransferase